MCQFTYRLQVPVATVLEQIRQLAEQYQGEFHGDEHSGRIGLTLFLGSIAGTYTINGDELRLEITQKPFLLGCGAIDAVIRQYLPVLA
jgi:hypothetical protein